MHLLYTPFPGGSGLKAFHTRAAVAVAAAKRESWLRGKESIIYYIRHCTYVPWLYIHVYILYTRTHKRELTNRQLPISGVRFLRHRRSSS